MPNETSNFIQIYGEQEKIDNFINIHKKLIPIEYNKKSSVEEDGNLEEHTESEDYYWDFEVSVPLNDENNKENENGNENENNYNKIREKIWGTGRGLLRSHIINNNIISIDTPWTSCLIWFKSMIKKYPDLTFSIKYNDEFQEDFYGWAIAVNGKIIDEEEICLHRNEDQGGIDLFKNHNSLH